MLGSPKLGKAKYFFGCLAPLTESTTMRLLLAVLSSVLLIVGCSTGPSGTTKQATSTAVASSTDIPVEDGAYPATVTHAFGDVTVDKSPTRVVALGANDADFALSLGVLPVAISAHDWGGNENKSTSWQDEAITALGGDPTTLPRLSTSSEIPIEQVATAQPDLILAVYSGITQEEYNKLSKIAPVVAYPDAPWMVDWKQQGQLIGTALGRPAAAQRINDDAERAFRDAAAQHPKLKEVSAAWAYFDSSKDAALGLYINGDLRNKALTMSGTKVSGSVAELEQATDTFYAPISPEKAPSVDADVLVFDAGENSEILNAVKASPLASQISALQSGRYYAITDKSTYLAMSMPSPLTLPVAAKSFLPKLAAAANGTSN